LAVSTVISNSNAKELGMKKIEVFDELFKLEPGTLVCIDMHAMFPNAYPKGTFGFAKVPSQTKPVIVHEAEHCVLRLKSRQQVVCDFATAPGRNCRFTISPDIFSEHDLSYFESDDLAEVTRARCNRSVGDQSPPVKAWVEMLLAGAG
jgi:hypothetical protein